MGDAAPPAGRSSRWGDLGRRAVSAALLAPIVLACIWFGGVPFLLLFLAGAIGLAIEWVGLCRIDARRWPGVLLPVLVVVAGGLAAAGFAAQALFVVLGGAVMIGWLLHRPLLAAGLVYIGLALVALLWLRGGTAAEGRQAVLFVVLVIWASDIGAYTAGRLLRGPKLAPALSPAKTWSGAVGGLVAATIIGELVSSDPGAAAGVFAAVLSVVCQAGDLLESGIKRHVGVKDSGRLIPGHGGLLDRLDGLLAAAPVAAIVMLASREGWF